MNNISNLDKIIDLNNIQEQYICTNDNLPKKDIYSITFNTSFFDILYNFNVDTRYE